MGHGGGRGRRVAEMIAGVVAVAVLMGGCSSDDSGGAETERSWTENYCRALGAWQRVRNSAEDGAASDAAEEAGGAVVTAARRLPSASYEGAGDAPGMLDVTVAALRGDTAAEGRAVDYCATAGFETLTR